jgi:hypothetical protein
MAQKILNSSVFTNLVEIAPGLKEFFFWLQELSERRANGWAAAAPDYDYLIWDAPAGGHFRLRFDRRRISRYFHRRWPRSEPHRFFSNRRNIQLFPVTPLEEMAIAETLEMAIDGDDFEIPARLLVNCASRCARRRRRASGPRPAAESSAAMRLRLSAG